LRDQAELAAQRVAQLENRLAHAVTAQPQQAAGVVAAPPNVVPAAAAHVAPTFGAVGNPAPPAGVAAPPLSAATKLIPTPPVQPPAFGAPGVAAARLGTPAATHPSVVAASAGAATSPPAGASPPGFPPPVNRIVTPRPATPAGGATATNGTGEHQLVPPPLPIPPLPPRSGGAGSPPSILGGLGLGDGPGEHNALARVLTGVAAVAVLVAIVAILLSVTSGGSPSHTTSHPSAPVSNAPKAHHPAAAKPAPVTDGSVTVAVLNGTPVYHLANDIATQLGADGFKEGTITNAATQTQPTTTIEYVPGDQRDAAAVQKALKLGASSVQPITSDTQALGCPQTASCSVVVTVGADETSAQTQTTP
jgi:hypothetical protein